MFSNRLIIPNLDELGIEPRTFRIQGRGKTDDGKSDLPRRHQWAGMLVLGYGDADTAGTVDLTTVLETPTFSRRCGSNEIKCFSENQAAASSCMTLIDGLLATRNNFPNSPRCVRQLGRQLVACLGAVDGEEYEKGVVSRAETCSRGRTVAYWIIHKSSSSLPGTVKPTLSNEGGCEPSTCLPLESLGKQQWVKSEMIKEK
ncbi:hypothetical protein B0T13DRAFT_450613 [Neurospora crassa]|nr:hypothetical protein B0T13DRAFT_450613 [Neurospora crassa]